MNARGVKAKPKKRKPTKPDNPAQSARFIEAAKKLGLDGKGQEFDKAMDVLAPYKSASRKQKGKQS